jgi:putative SOS response-associated peptidase YedK
LWETWGSNGGTLRTATIVTTAANETVGAIHDRMPVILESREERRWLAAERPDDLRSLLEPYPDDGLEAYPVSTAVNDPANDSPAVVEPVDVDEQSSLGEFG